MGKRIFLAAAMILLSGTAFVEHAFTLEPDTAPAVKPAPATPPSVSPATPPAVPPAPPVIMQEPQPAPKATLPSELDVYLVWAAASEVCTVSDWGFDETRRECRTEPVPV